MQAMSRSFFGEMPVPNPAPSDYDLPLRQTFYPLGFPLRLETNSEDVVESAREGWGPFSQAFDEPAVRLCLNVSDSDTTLSQPRSEFRWHEHLMQVFADPETFLTCDFNRGLAFGSVTRAVAADHALLRYRMLTCGAMMLIAQRALAPLHAALIVRNGCGVMLCGESFAGKSTLSYAASRAGWTFVTDDGTSLVRARSDRYAVGNPHSIRFREDAQRFFPELLGQCPRIRPNGKFGLEIFTRELPMQVAPGCSVEYIVYLDRQASGPARLRRYEKTRALADWERYAVFGADHVRAAQRRCYQRLLAAGLFEMQYADMHDAVERLEQLVDSGA
jgi:hypothetical protein